MKLKYYLSGLGVGIILTTLILTISGNDKMSEQEIRREALKLGMVEKEEQKDELKEVLEDINPTTEPEKETSDAQEDVENQEASGEEDSSKQESPSETPTVEPTSAVEPTPTATPTPTLEPTPTEAPTPTPKPDTKPDEDEISFTIKRGMSSNKVSIMLESLELVEDAADFNKYILREGKADVIQTGTYSIRKGASYYEILNMIISR